MIAGLSTDGNGVLVLSSTWPTGLPSGFETWYQAWYEDFTAPVGIASTNALLGTTP